MSTPRRTETARLADEHVAILPGGDAALLLGMLRVLVLEDRLDRKAIAAEPSGAIVAPSCIAPGSSMERITERTAQCPSANPAKTSEG